jgi:hypothetical protein
MKREKYANQKHKGTSACFMFEFEYLSSETRISKRA